MTKQLEPLLFLSGSGLPGWIWDDVRSMLRDNQLSAVATRPRNHVSAGLGDYAEQALADAPAPTFTIVAHSLGAVIGMKMGHLAPERINRFLAVSGVVPDAGRSFILSMPFPNRLVLGAAMRLAGTRPPDKAIRRTLAGLDEAKIDRVIDDFTPEPYSLFRERLPHRPLPPRRGYLHTSADRELPAKLQTRFANNLDVGWTQTISTGHMPMLEDPKSLGSAIDAFLGDGRSPSSLA